jgi:hypothetical protein
MLRCANREQEINSMEILPLLLNGVGLPGRWLKIGIRLIWTMDNQANKNIKQWSLHNTYFMPTICELSIAFAFGF